MRARPQCQHTRRNPHPELGASLGPERPRNSRNAGHDMGLDQIEVKSQTRRRLFEPGEHDASFTKFYFCTAPRRSMGCTWRHGSSRSASVLSAFLVILELVEISEPHFAQCTIVRALTKAAGTRTDGTQVFCSCHRCDDANVSA